MKPIIYFYLPVYDEQETVGVLLYRLSEVMRDLRFDYEVHLTLDGCSDDSAEVVEPYLKRIPLRVVHNSTRLGYGKCLLDAIKRVLNESTNPRRDYFIVLDADFSLDPGLVSSMAAGIDRNVDLYLPHRFGAGRKGHRLAKWLAHLVAGRILRLRGFKRAAGLDLFTGLRACRVGHLRRSLKQLEALGSFGPGIHPSACSALLLLALANNVRHEVVIEVAERKKRRRESRFSWWPNLRFAMKINLVKEETAKVEQAPQRPRQGRRRSNKYRRRPSNQRKTADTGNKSGKPAS
ncbi:MAG TPA: glycosyltransferase [Candidatus Glassbacteria bacterium]|nr:glycosyltransferase [Candidatus Glassbacteria bacterium]